MLLILGFALVVLLLPLLVIYGSLKKNRWGINPKAAVCPACGSELPRVRKPASLRQALWGGYTCKVCGTEIDKWGRVVAGQN